MGRTLTKEEIFSLSVGERLELIETLWNSISPDDLPVPDSHKMALDESLADYARDRARNRKKKLGSGSRRPLS